MVSIDVQKNDHDEYEVFIDRGRVGTNTNPIDWAKKAEKSGAGEIFLTSIDHDGGRKGYDLELLKKVLLASLHNKLFSYQGFDFISPDSLKSFDMHEDEVVVYLESGKKISSEQVVAFFDAHAELGYCNFFDSQINS